MENMQETQNPASLKLVAELVPRPCWYSNMRSLVPRPAWDKLRRQVYAQYQHRCGICGADERLHCHEIWLYDDTAHIQTLAGFIALCGWCHHVKHLGHSAGLASEGKLDYNRVIEHFMRVNNCTLEEFETHRSQVFEQWEARNQHTWQTVLGDYQRLVEKRT
jgi:hypothetical protein